MDNESESNAARTEQFVALLGRHERSLLAYILSLVTDWNVAEDLAQETRLRLWQQFDQYDPQKDFGAWARTIAHYQVLQYRTRRGREPLQFDDTIFASVADTAASRVDDAPRRLSALAFCLEKLGESKQRILRRLYGDNETLRDIASSEDRSYASTRQNVVRIRRALRDCTEKKIGSDS